MAAEVPFLAATHKAFPRLFARQNSNNAPSASLWLTNISVQVSLVLIWLTGSDYGTLLTIASEMILVPYLLVGAFLLKIATRPLHKAVAIGACIYGIWLLYASGPVHLLLSVVLFTLRVFLVFLYARTYAPARSFAQTPRSGANWFIAGCRCAGNVDAGGVSGRPAAERIGDTHG